MGQGFQRKIDTIVDSIVSSEKENNKKVDEFDIAENIKRAISDLNDVGKLLVLDDLSKEAGSKPSTLLTIDGKISINKLNEMVVAKIKEAEREGVDIRTNQPLIKEKNNIMIDGIITMIVIDKMIENYQELSSDERNNLLQKYSDLTEEQQRKIDEEVARSYNETKEKLTQKEKEAFSQKISENDEKVSKNRKINRYMELSKKELTRKEKQELEELVEQLKAIDKEFFREDGTPDFHKMQKAKEENVLSVNKFDEKLKRYRELSEKRESNLIEEWEKNELLQLEIEFENNGNDKQNKIVKEVVEKISKEGEEKQESEKERDFKDSTSKNQQIEQEYEWAKTNINIDKDLRQLPIATLQDNFSSQEIKEAVEQYKKYFITLDIESISTMKSFDKDKFQEALIEEFQELEIGGNVGKIVEELAKISYDGNLKNIITDDKSREEFIQELDKQIESLEPEKEEKQPQEEVDMESVKSELTAIPKALVSIDASTQDIAEGMQGYKQLIDNLDTKEIEGKSNEDVLKVLAGKVSEIALSGNANLILEMMTQIGFSGLKNSEMKISPILTTVKSEFVQIIDDVSKEEYIEKTRNEMLAKEPIRDAEAEPGMKSFMVDLRVATKERNDLTNQIVGKDEKQDNITGSSDSDATQGSTSSGKILLQNMMNTVQNVRMSEIQNVQDLMVSIVKENIEKVQEQDELVQDEEQDMV